MRPVDRDIVDDCKAAPVDGGQRIADRFVAPCEIRNDREQVGFLRMAGEFRLIEAISFRIRRHGHDLTDRVDEWATRLLCDGKRKVGTT